MDFDKGVNIVYGDGQKKDDIIAAEKFLNDIPVSVGGGVDLEMSALGGNVSFDPRIGVAAYSGIANVDTQKYDVKFCLSCGELGDRPIVLITERGGERRLLRLFAKPRAKDEN